ncbi:MAG: TRAP transporter small permease subunit [Granulosicoccus sp.]
MPPFLSWISLVVSWVFGLVLLALSLFVAAETISRKLFNFSFQGADELGGYVLAIGGALSFTIALLQRAHIRIDIIHDRLSPRIQAYLNWISAISLALMGGFLARYCWLVVRDTLLYGSTAPTAWATPMIYPQSVWYICLLAFSITSVILAIIATKQLLQGDFEALNTDFKPKGVMEELEDELEDLTQRQSP